MSRCARAVPAAGLTTCMVLAGCLLGSGALEDHLPAAGIVARGSGDVVVAEDNEPLVMDGQCDGLCSVEMAVAADDERLERLFVTVAWDGAQNAGLEAHAWQAHEVRRGHDAVRLTFQPPLPEDLMVDLRGSGEYHLSARLVYRPAGEDLPDLVTTLPGGVRIPAGIEEHDGEQVEFVAGCRPEERDAGAVRCLRFGNAPGNVGSAPLRLRLVQETGAYMQQVEADGTTRERSVGGGEYHPHHDHFHYAGFAQTDLYRFDLESGLRGEEVVAGTKTGFCPLDSGAMDDAEPEPAPRHFTKEDCQPPASAPWITGVSVGRYDLYPSHFVDQYVEVAGVPDGVYQLVSVVDPAGGLLEQDRSNNAASVLLRLERDEVEILEGRALYGMVDRMY